MNMDEGEGKVTGEDIKNEVMNELKETRPIQPEDKYNHLLFLCLKNSEGHLNSFIIETIRSFGGEGEIVVWDDGVEYRLWDTLKEEDFGNILYNMIMNLGKIYNQLCSGKEEDTIGDIFKTEGDASP